MRKFPKFRTLTGNKVNSILHDEAGKVKCILFFFAPGRKSGNLVLRFRPVLRRSSLDSLPQGTPQFPQSKTQAVFSGNPRQLSSGLNFGNQSWQLGRTALINSNPSPSHIHTHLIHSLRFSHFLTPTQTIMHPLFTLSPHTSITEHFENKPESLVHARG